MTVLSKFNSLSLYLTLYCILSGSLLISWPETLAVDALPVLGFLAKVVRRLHESYVVGLCSRIFDVNICNRTNLIRLRSLWLSENVETAFVISCNQGWVICRHFSRIWGRALILATAQKILAFGKFWITVLWSEEYYEANALPLS